MAFRFHGHADWRIQRVLIAERFPGWTLEYIDGLDIEDLLGVTTVTAMEDKAKSDGMKSHEFLSGGSKR
jgi:hypothetical protein